MTSEEEYYVEVWAGTRSFSKYFESRGVKTWSTDINPEFDVDLVGDVLDTDVQRKIVEMVKHKNCKGVWMSPVCTKWSLSAGNTYWDEFRMPKREETIEAIKMMMFCRLLADICIDKNKLFWIENPNGRAVWIMDNQYLKKVWYCQYGDTRAKPTNIWTNQDIEFKICKKYNSKQVKGLEPLHCHHEMAVRGSKTGTQGLKGNMERSVIPPQLFHAILDRIKETQKEISKR